MADLNDQTQNVNIWNDAKTKAVTVTTDGAKERLDVNAGTLDDGESLVTITHPHHELHQGRHFTYSDVTVDAGIDIDDTMEYLLKGASTVFPHIIFLFNFGLRYDVVIYENPTVTANGTLQSTHDNNRNTANSAGLLIYKTPTLSANGTMIFQSFAATGAEKGGGVLLSEQEWYLKENEDYYLVITSHEEGNRGFLSFHWYENEVT